MQTVFSNRSTRLQTIASALEAGGTASDTLVRLTEVDGGRRRVP